MLNLSFFRTRKIIILFKNQFLKTKHDYSFQVEGKFEMKRNSSNDKKLNECIKHGLSAKTILTNNWIFDMDLNHLNFGLNLLKKWNPNQMDDLFVLLQMPVTKLIYITKKTMWESQIIPQRNRIYYFATNFEKTPQEVCYHMMKYTFLYTRNFTKLHQIHQILIENNVHKNEIWNDIWIFMYGFNQIQERIVCLNNGNVVIKPWMLRCKLEVFKRTLELKQEKNFVLNNDSTAQYLAKRLNVSMEAIRIISSKYPSILRVSPIKLKEVLDFLLNEGFYPFHILKTPRVLTHSLLTLQERLIELRDLGFEPTLTALCKNKMSYQELVDNLILKNNKELKMS